MKGKIKKALSIALSTILAVEACAMTVPALTERVYAAGTGKNLQLRADVLATNAGASGAATVYYGKNNQTWRVIGYGTTGVASTSGKLALLAGSAMGSLTEFNEYSSGQDCNNYNGSKLQEAMNALLSDTYFSSKERDVIAPRNLAVEEYIANAPYSDGVSGTEVDSQSLWPLSTKEAYTLYDNGSGITNIRALWWLRSPGEYIDFAAFVDDDGDVDDFGNLVGILEDVRPAFNLNLSSIILTSAAEGGKSSGTAGAAALTAPTDYAGNEWKLTLLDSSRNFSATRTDSGTVAAGNNISINYTGATVGTNEYVSAILLDSSDNLLYYGRITGKSSGDTGGTANITIPARLKKGTYKIKVFSEQYNDDKKTDYVSNYSNPISVDVIGSPAADDFSVTFPSNAVYNGDSKEATVTTATGVTGMGAITVKYKDAAGEVSSTAPILPGTYQVLLDVVAGTDYVADTGITDDDWKFTISPAGTVATPTFDPAENTFTGAKSVSIVCATEGATIHYTTDGSTPTTSSDVNSEAITVSKTMTIKAIAVKTGWTDSEVATATYTIKSSTDPTPTPDPDPKPTPKPAPIITDDTASEPTSAPEPTTKTTTNTTTDPSTGNTTTTTTTVTKTDNGTIETQTKTVTDSSGNVISETKSETVTDNKAGTETVTAETKDYQAGTVTKEQSVTDIKTGASEGTSVTSTFDGTVTGITASSTTADGATTKTIYIPVKTETDKLTLTAVTVTGTGEVTVPSSIKAADGKTYTVTGIGPRAFKDDTSIVNVTIPSTITEIGQGAFNGATSVQSITIYVEKAKDLKVMKNAVKGLKKNRKVNIHCRNKKQFEKIKAKFRAAGGKNLTYIFVKA